MLFNTHEFLFLFLPITLAGFVLLLTRERRQPAVWWLTACSFVFYWSLDGRHLSFLASSAMLNFVMARLIADHREMQPRAASRLFWLALLLNIGAFVYFKYGSLFSEPLGIWAASSGSPIPLGISFFTIQQIVFLIETRQEDSEPPKFTEYLLFVSFFPYVIAGPMTRPKEILPQLREMDVNKIRTFMLPAVTLFAIGLFKKVVIADNVAPMVDEVFGLAFGGMALSTFDGWAGALLYTLQIYFDFSGYTDMAAGIAGMFGFRLPVNFNSPHKACSIMEFWQRWHMTMTRFFTEFVFLPLAVAFTRLVIRRRIQGVTQLLLRMAAPLVITFFVIGIWHGAGSNFAVFALLMSGAMAINHAWKSLRQPSPPTIVAWSLTMGVVVTGMVLDRAPDITTAGIILGAMTGLKAGASVVLDPMTVLPWLVVLGFVVLRMPNSHEIMARFPVVLPGPWDTIGEKWRGSRWSNGPWGVAFTGTVLCISVLSIAKASQFIYYRF